MTPQEMTLSPTPVKKLNGQANVHGNVHRALNVTDVMGKLCCNPSGVPSGGSTRAKVMD